MKSKAGWIALAGLLALPVAQAGDLLLRAGVHDVSPKSNLELKDAGISGIDVSDNATLSLGATWFLTQNVAVDLLGAIPFRHDVKIGGTTVATVKHLPPTLGVQYHFNPGGAFDPYVGAGVNVTFFFSEEAKGPLAGTDVSAGTSVGPALQVGGDFALTKDWVLGLDVRWAKIGTEVKDNGVKLGTLDLDPFVYGITIGRRFSL